MKVEEQIERWIDEIGTEFRSLLRVLPEQAQRDFLADKLAPRLEAACKDPEFKNNYLCHRVHQEIDEFLESHQPQGQYDPKAFFLKDDQGIYQFMDGATREDLAKWRAIIA
jgi:hypothetical protein